MRETRQVVAWMETAFEACAKRFKDTLMVREPNETSEQCRARILRYGVEFSRVLRGTADYHVADENLLDDLHSLMKLGCPALDIVDLMLTCTNWFGGDISYFDQVFGIPDKLNNLRTNCRQLSEVISDTRELPVPLHEFLREQFPSQRERRRARRLIHSLPEALYYMEKLLENYPFVPGPATKTELKHSAEAYFYALLCHFGAIEAQRRSRRNWYETLSSLLQAIRAVRLTVLPDAAAYSRNIAPITIRSGKRKGESKDHFNASAIEKRLTRFFKIYPRFWFAIDVSQYMMDDYAEHRRNGETLLSLLPQLGKDRNTRERLLARVIGKA